MSKRLRYCGMMYNIFLCVQRALVLCKFVLYFSACRTCFGIIKFHVILFCVWTMLWNCEIFCSMFLQMEYALILWNSFLNFDACGCALVLRNFMLYFSVFVMRSGIIKFCVIFFCMCKALWYRAILCYIVLRVVRGLVLRNSLSYVLHVEGAMVLWDFVLHFLCYSGTCFGIIQFLLYPFVNAMFSCNV